MASEFRNQAVGAGAAVESVVATNGTITIPANRTLRITDVVLSYGGAGVLRIRQNNILGPVLFMAQFGGQGSFEKTFKTPMLFEGGSTGLVIVITEEGAFPNSFLISGVMS